MERIFSDTGSLPVVTLYSGRPGPRVLITAGVHGGEYAAIAAGLQLSDRLYQSECCGQVTIVCPANVNAFWQRTEYVDPADGKNLGSVFPGNPQGTSAERTAWQIAQWIRQSDYYLDLHAGDIHEHLTPFSLFPANTPVSQHSLQMARAAGLPYIIPMQSKGLPICDAAAAFKPCVMIEMGGCGRWDTAETKRYTEAVMGVLRSAGTLPGAAPCTGEVLPGYLSVKAPMQACWESYVQPGEWVVRGQMIGRLFNFQNHTLLHCRAEQDGVLLYVVTSLSVSRGGSLYALGVRTPMQKGSCTNG